MQVTQRKGLKEIQVNTFNQIQSKKLDKPTIVKQIEVKETQEIISPSELASLKYKLQESERLIRLQRETIQNLKKKVERLENEKLENEIQIQHTPHKGIFWEEK
jgi:hypothetical protein